MVQKTISLYRQNQAKLFRQIKTDETETILRQENLGSVFLKGFSDARRGWGAQNRLFAVRSTFGSHLRGEELIKELQRSLIGMSFRRDMEEATSLER